MSLGDRVRRARRALGLTQVQLVAAVRKRGGDLSQSQLSAIEKDEVERPGALPELAAVLKTTTGELLGKSSLTERRPDEDDEPMTPIAHYVGAGDEVHLIDDAGSRTHIDYTAAPPGFAREDGAAVQVRGDSMRPLYEPGDLLFFRRKRESPATLGDLPDRPVIVQVREGPLYVKRLLPGTKKGRFHLISVNPLTPVLQDQPVESFALIEWVKPRV